MRTTVIDHPLVAERLTILRDATTVNAAFRQALDGLAGMLIYEASRSLPVEAFDVRTPITTTTGVRLGASPMLVPILRAGVGMVDAALRLLPSAEVGFVGLARDEETFEPRPYLAKLPERLDGRPVRCSLRCRTGGSIGTRCCCPSVAARDAIPWCACWRHPKVWPDRALGID